MAKSAFDDNVPRVRPRLRLGKALGELDTVTEPPPVRSREEAVESAAIEEPREVPERSIIRDHAPEPVVEPEHHVEAAEQLNFEPEVPAAVVTAPEPPVLETPVERVVNVGVPAVGDAEALPAEAEAAAPTPPPAPEPPPTPASTVKETIEDSNRRSSLKRRAAGLSTLPEEQPAPIPAAILDELDALESTAELAAELQRALDSAAEANEHLRGDLSAALDDLARSTAESKRLHERVERLEAEARDRSKVVQDLVRELELLEAERDSALMQSSDAQLELETHGDKMLLLERRIHDLERALTESQARTKRFEEAAQAHAAQRTALRAELDAIRRERDALLTRNAELEREKEDLGRSRKALDEVHRALSEARSRAQRIRPR